MMGLLTESEIKITNCNPEHWGGHSNIEKGRSADGNWEKLHYNKKEQAQGIVHCHP